MSNTDPFDQHGTAAARPAGGQAAVRNDERGTSMQGASMQGASMQGASTQDTTEYRDDTMARREPVRYQDGGGDRNDRIEPDDIPTRKVRETKPAFLTTEFWFAVGGIAALIAVYAGQPPWSPVVGRR